MDIWDKPDSTIDLSEFMVITNVLSGHNNIITLFWENKLGVDVNVCNLLLIFGYYFDHL